MAIIKGPISLPYYETSPKVQYILNDFLTQFCPNHRIKRIYIDTDHRTGDHLIKMVLENTL